jgi:hypothetical protein
MESILRRHAIAGLGWFFAFAYFSFFSVMSANAASILRTDFYVGSGPGITIYLREVRDQSRKGGEWSDLTDSWSA